MKLKIILAATTLSAVLPFFVFAADNFPGLKVVPWDGHKAATSLTFDGSDPTQLDIAVPELNQRRLHGTFFLVANRTNRKDEWRQILPSGHEIGNLTLDYKHAGDLTPRDEEAQVVGARNVLQKEFGIVIETFAYPYGAVTPGLKESVGKTHFLGRGGDAKSFILIPAMNPDWMDIPSKGTESHLVFSTYKKWINECNRKKGWLVWRIQGLEGAPLDRQPISRKIFEHILDAIQTKDMWVGTFLEVGAYFRAQKIFEKAAIQRTHSEENYIWDVPDHFPGNVFLKIRLQPSDSPNPGTAEIWQGGQKLEPDEKGLFSINFSLKGLTLRLTPKT